MPDTGEHTNIIVAQMLKRRRRVRIPIIIGSALIGLFAIYMGIGFGDRKHDLETKVDGPVVPEHGASAPRPAPAVKSQAHQGTDSPTAADAPEMTAKHSKASVRVMVAGAKGHLFIDGEEVAFAQDTKIEMAAGSHTVMVRQGAHTLTQKLSVSAGEELDVKFGTKVTVAKAAAKPH